MKSRFSVDQLRTWLGVGIIALIALGSFWLLEVMRRADVEGNSPSTPRDEPDYYVENFNLIRLPNDGKANYHMTGARLTHIPANDSFEIALPQVSSFGDQQTPINIRAQKAIVEQKDKTGVSDPDRMHDKIHLYGDVQVNKPASAHSGMLQVYSDYLLFLPDDDVLKTDKEVTIYTDSAEIHATGLLANNRDQQVTLLSKVRALINPHSAIQLRSIHH
jgi:lipopolysaccharide export system protein LptC